MSFSFCLNAAATEHGASSNSRVMAECQYNESGMMSLSLNEFDQTPGKGWRQVADKSGCEMAAADLIAKYRGAHKTTSELIYWHEAQLRAFSGSYDRAIALMNLSHKSRDSTGWNAYVDATISFLRHNKKLFVKYKERLSKTPVPDGVGPAHNGFIYLNAASGEVMKMIWPINIDVLNGLSACFNKPYKEAYGDGCRYQVNQP